MRRRASEGNGEINNQLVLSVIDSFISYYEKIAELSGDGMLKIKGKQVSLRDFENLMDTQKVTLLSEKDNTTALNPQYLCQQDKAAELYGNVFKSSEPSASISCRIKPDALASNYGITPPEVNYRQLILLNNVFFESGMDVMTKNPTANHAVLGKLFGTALKGIDFSKMGMAEKGDYQPNQQILTALRERRQELATPAASPHVKPAKAHSASAAEDAKPARKFSFFKRTASSPHIDPALSDLQKKAKTLEKEISALNKIIDSKKTSPETREESEELLKKLQEQYMQARKAITVMTYEIQQKNVKSPGLGKK